MTISASPLFADGLVGCVAEGRDPTVHELFYVAQRIWSEGAVDRPVFAWATLPSGSPDRVLAVRAAHLALCGSNETSKS